MKNKFIFIHGVNVRNEGYSNKLFDKIRSKSSAIAEKQIEIFWGRVNEGDVDNLRSDWAASKQWKELQFKDIRKGNIARFMGDAALYISRSKGCRVVKTIYEQLAEGLKGFDRQNDRLHLVSHSWGTVILFDILFSSRWDEWGGWENGIDYVKKIRENIYGVRIVQDSDVGVDKGYVISSIHTMGSPLSIYQLMIQNTVATDDSKSTHDIRPGLKKFIDETTKVNGFKKFPWNNYIHPGDPIGYPLERVIPNILGDSVEVKDIISKAGFFGAIVNILPSEYAQLARGIFSNAHGSYWDDGNVADSMVEHLK